MTETVPEYLVEILEKAGVKRAYGVVGGSLILVEKPQELNGAIAAAFESRVMKGTMT